MSNQGFIILSRYTYLMHCDVTFIAMWRHYLPPTQVRCKEIYNRLIKQLKPVLQVSQEIICFTLRKPISLNPGLTYTIHEPFHMYLAFVNISLTGCVGGGVKMVICLKRYLAYLCLFHISRFKYSSDQTCAKFFDESILNRSFFSNDNSEEFESACVHNLKRYLDCLGLIMQGK